MKVLVACQRVVVYLILLRIAETNGTQVNADTSFKNLVSKTKATLTAPKAFMRSERAFVEAEPEEKHRDFGGGRRITASTTTTTTTYADFQFGGTKHVIRSIVRPPGWWGAGANYNEFILPEAVKSKACKTNPISQVTRCWDCSQASQCFHGKTQSEWPSLVVNVAAGSAFTHYEAEIWARCPLGNKGALVEVECDRKINGKIEIYVGNKKAVFPGSAKNKVHFRPNSRSKKEPQFTLAREFRIKERIRVLFFPTILAKKSSARFDLSIWGADSSVAGCMAVKDCLGMLGTGSDAAFKLRNGNGLQLKCLTGKLKRMSAVEETVLETCEEWKKCVKESGKKKELIAILRAGLKKTKQVLLEGVSLSSQTCLDANADTCVEPDTSDPESWDCECAEGMLAACSDYKGNELASCIQGLMCQDSNVCCSWKQDHCASHTTSTGSEMAERSSSGNISAAAALSETSANQNAHGTLDETLAGKCSV